ncbi:MAG: glutaredoxin domain-containing protein [Candidatus Dojkabacteria bacterium]|nr:MAG: glutaredoxin domain-containing protein [Candidatus Dojkabacteria bacterium]
MFRKYLAALFVTAFVALFSVTTVFAQDTEETLDVETTDESAATEVENGGLPEQTFLIYVHEDCPHCQRVEAFVEEQGIQDQVEYVELKNNQENMDALQAEWEKFNVPTSDQGWPFMVYEDENGDETYATGDEPIIQILSQYNGIPYTAPDNGEDTTTSDSPSGGLGDSVFLVLGGVVLMFIVGYGVYSAASKK